MKVGINWWLQRYCTNNGVHLLPVRILSGFLIDQKTETGSYLELVLDSFVSSWGKKPFDPRDFYLKQCFSASFLIAARSAEGQRIPWN